MSQRHRVATTKRRVELEHLRGFAPRMLRRLPPPALLATPPLLIQDLARLSSPGARQYLFVEVICLADKALEQIPGPEQPGHPLFQTRGDAINALRLTRL